MENAWGIVGGHGSKKNHDAVLTGKIPQWEKSKEIDKKKCAHVPVRAQAIIQQ